MSDVAPVLQAPRSVSSPAAAGRLEGYHDDQIQTIMAALKAKDFMRVGSTITCSPPPADTDVDVLVLVQKRDAALVTGLGFDLDRGGEHYEPSEGDFNSWRRGDLNLIVTDSLRFYNAFWLATKVAKTLNLMAKADRVTLFQAILYGRHHGDYALPRKADLLDRSESAAGTEPPLPHNGE